MQITYKRKECHDANSRHSRHMRFMLASGAGSRARMRAPRGLLWPCGLGRRLPGLRLAEPAATGGGDGQGKVVEVDYLPGATAGSGMVEIRVDAGGRTTAVRLGPAGFLSQNGVAVKEGDAVRVRGYRVTTGDGDMLVATEMAKGGKSLALRNSAGRPAW